MRYFNALFIRSNVFVSLCAASLCWQTQFSVNGNYSPDTAVFIVFLTCLLIYNVHRLFKVQRKTGQSGLNSKALFGINGIMAAIAFIAVLPPVLNLNRYELTILAICAFISFAYTLSMSGKIPAWLSIRSIPYLKVPAVAFVWTLMTVLLPLGIAFDNWGETGLLFVERFSFVFAITIPFDVRDMDVDRSDGINSIVLKIGWQRSKEWAIYILGFFAVLVFAGYITGIRNAQEAIALLLSTALTLMVFRRLHPSQDLLYYALLVESMSLIQSSLVCGMGLINF